MEEYRSLGKIEHFSQLFVHDTFCHRGFTAHEGVYMGHFAIYLKNKEYMLTLANLVLIVVFF